MIETSDQVEPVYPSATIVLVRDGEAGLEVLLVQRANAVKHMGGMWVFPGGKVEEGDHPEDRDTYVAAINAAIRETHEEAGVRVSPDQLVFLSHWTTPEGAKRRFATWFFLTILEDDQEVQVDGGEIANHRWVSPAQAMQESQDEAHPLRLMPPTFVSILELAACSDCADARRRLGAAEVCYFEPCMVIQDEGMCFLYAGDAGYESADADATGPRHRLYMVNDRLDYIREI